MKIIWTRRALREIDEISAYVAGGNRSVASALVSMIETRTQGLAVHPDIGRPGREHGTRELALAGAPYMLPYRVRDGRIEILTVLHTSRAFPDKL